MPNQTKKLFVAFRMRKGIDDEVVAKSTSHLGVLRILQKKGLTKETRDGGIEVRFVGGSPWEGVPVALKEVLLRSIPKTR